MINVQFNTAVKALGAKWDASEKRWVAPELAKTEFDALDQKYNKDLVVVELTITNENRDSGSWLGTAHAVSVSGYVFATAYGRDSGAKTAEGVSILSGKFGSGGSAKNYRCVMNEEGVRVRCKIARAMIESLKKQVSDFVVIDDNSTESNEKNIQAAIEFLQKNGYRVEKNVA